MNNIKESTIEFFICANKNMEFSNTILTLKISHEYNILQPQLNFINKILLFFDAKPEIENENIKMSFLNKKSKRDNFSELYKLCYKYTKNNSYVYKSCCDVSDGGGDTEREWLVILQKLNDTKTNEMRNNIVDKNCAKFRANKLKVIKIFNMINPKITKEFVINKFCGSEIKYEINKIVQPDCYDDDINNVCTGGIHYYKTMAPAYYYRVPPDDYTGSWIAWYNSGQWESTYQYVDGDRVKNKKD